MAAPSPPKASWPDVKVYAAEPTASPVLSGGTHTPQHREDRRRVRASVMRADLLDGLIEIAPEDAWPMPEARLRGAGVLIGISSGACLAAVAQLLREVPDGSRILTFNCDSRDRYLSIDAPGRPTDRSIGRLTRSVLLEWVLCSIWPRDALATKGRETTPAESQRRHGASEAPESFRLGASEEKSE